jgi:hypothetical protein
MMRIVSIFARITTGKHPRIIIPLYTLINILVYVGLTLVTIAVYYILAPAVGSALPWIDYISTSPAAILTLLVVISTIDFGSVFEELQNPSWQAIFKAMRNPFLIILRILEEFTITTRLVRAVDAIVWGVAFWGSFRGNVESPDNNTLMEIVQGSLTRLLGPSLVLFYRSETLYPTSTYPELADLEENILQYLLDRRPGAFIGIYEGKCALVAYTSTEDVRRMNIWTRSSALTRNIVTKARKVLLELKQYEAD